MIINWLKTTAEGTGARKYYELLEWRERIGSKSLKTVNDEVGRGWYLLQFGVRVNLCIFIC